MILGIDTTSKTTSISLGTKKEILFSSRMKRGNSNSKTLSLMVKNGLNLLDKNISELNQIAVVDGPGSFTGLRIGFSYAKGLAYSLNLEKYKLSKLYLPLLFINNFHPSVSEFYHIIKIKNGYHIAAYFREKTFIKPDIFILQEGSIEPNIPVIHNDNELNLTNPVISFYNREQCFSDLLLNTIFHYEIEKINDDHFFVPQYFKKSEAEIKAGNKK